MTLNINQFAQTPVQGQMDLEVQGTVIVGQVGAAQATPLIAGQAVKLSTVGGGVPKFLALAANTDQTFGFVARNLKDQAFPAQANMEVAMQNSVMWMTAGAAITRGAKLEVVYTTNKVITNAGTNPVVGFALDKATADGDLIRVYIITQAYQSAQTIDGVADLAAALTSLPNGNIEAITSINTVGAGTLTAAAIAGGVITRGGSQTAVFTDTTGTGTDIAAEFPSYASAGANLSYEFVYRNNTSYTATIAGGTGVTVTGATVNPLSWARYLITQTGAATFTMVQLGTGPLTNEIANYIDSLAEVSTAQLDKTNDTLATVTGCTVNLTPGKYIIQAHISGTATANGGAKAALAGDGTLAMTTFSATGKNYNAGTLNAQTTTTTLGNAVGAATAVFTDMDIEAAMVVSVAGVLSLQFAQNVTHVDTSSAYVNSFIKATRVA